MKRLIISLILPAIISCYYFNAAPACVNSCDGITDGDWIQDQFDCHSFLVCPVDNETHYCGPDKIPDVDNKTCVTDTNPGGCISQCSGNCKTTCTVSETNLTDYKNDRLDCNIYYICVFGGEPIKQSCPPLTPNFDSLTKSCVDDESVCCKGCTPQCAQNPDGTDIDGNVEDPTDCHRYYICSLGDLTGPAYCHEGEIFNATSGYCEQGTSCNSPCGNEGTDTTTSPGGGETTTTSPGGGETTTTSPGGVETTTTSSGGVETTTPGGVETTTASTGGVELTTSPGGAETTTSPGGESTTTSPGSSEATTSGSETTTFPSGSTIGPTDASGCLISMICKEEGNFFKCPHCDKTYFHCESAHYYYAEEKQCPANRVFNPVADYPYCILPEECPHYPFIF